MPKTLDVLADLKKTASSLPGVVYTFGGAVQDLATTGSVNSGTALAFLSLVGMPVAFALIEAPVGSARSMLFNFSTRWLAGVNLELMR